MANEMKELHGAVFELTPDMISAVSLDEIDPRQLLSRMGRRCYAIDCS